MPTPLIYTTVEAIERKLKGRLAFGISQSIGGQAVSSDLVEQVAAQKIGYVNLIMGMIYEMPNGRLALDHEIIAEIVEDLVISSLIPISFQGAVTAEASDVSNAAINSRRNAELLLQMLTAGHNILIGGLPPVQNIPGAITPQPVYLPGETPRNAPDTLTRNTTLVGNRVLNVQNLGIYWGGGVGDYDRAPGARMRSQSGSRYFLDGSEYP